MIKENLKKLLGKKLLNLIHLIYPISVSKISLIFIKHKFKSFGSRTTISQPTIIRGKKNISVGEDTDIGSFVHIWGNGGVFIGNRVLIASHVSITSQTHDYSFKYIKFAPGIQKPIVINDDVWIGTHAVIMPGIEIGTGAVIGAGAIVTKNVPPMAIVAGCPAKIVKYRSNLIE